ncbi:hypothetical protein LCGC14_2920320 [marine sediment metagenome]|uniref:RNA polymerase sigma factor 70 region 4 type 2 domain-containing protein n=1 Tax=marine sediment metagenome TaxID=412755 RepID=A0A0F8XP83_9ZZZZ
MKTPEELVSEVLNIARIKGHARPTKEDLAEARAIPTGSVNWRRLRETLVSIALKELGGEAGSDYTDVAEDIVQSFILTLLIDKVTDEDEAFNLGTAAVIHDCVDYVRLERNRREIEAEHGASINRTLTGQSAESLSADPTDIMMADEMRARLNELSPINQATLDLHYIQGLDISAIAEMQGVTEVVIRKRLQRARDYIRADALEDTRTEDVRPSMEDIKVQQRDNFKRRDEGYIKRRIRHLNPDATLAQWEAMYGC